MVLLRSAFIVIVIVASSTSKDVNTTSVTDTKKSVTNPKQSIIYPTKAVVESEKANDVPTVNSRFFDLGGMLNQLFPGFNQGIQGGSAANPGGMDFQGNSQFYPDGASQGQNSQVPRAQGSIFPIIDDAKQYPSQRKNTGNFLGPQQFPTFGASQLSQYPNQGNIGGSQQMQHPNQGNFGGSQQNQYPNQGHFGGSQQTQYPNQGNFGGSQQMQYPNQGNFGSPQQSQYPNQGYFERPQSQYPDQGNFGGSQQNQYPNQGITTGWQQPQNPSQGNFGASPQNQYPNQVNFGGTHQSQNPGFGGFQYPNQNNQNGGQSNDGTLDGILPPDNPSDFTPDQSSNNSSQSSPNQQLYGGDGQTSAILGRPVVIPSTPTPEGQIFFPSSTENAFRRQCVQDCPTTSEYNPVCGTNNVTYFNPGRFVCARNCGINVFVLKQGRCGDTPPPRNVAKINLPVDQ